MRRGDIGDHRHMRAHELHQRGDLAGMVHADLEHAELGFGRHARQHQRHTPLIVETLDRGMRRAGARQNRPDRFLGGGLADAAGNRRDFGGTAGPAGPGEIAEPIKGIRHDDQSIAKPIGFFLADQRRDGAIGEGLRHEIMAIEPVALDGNEQALRRDLTRIDREAADAVASETFGPAPGCRNDFANREKPCHQCPFKASATTS